MRVELEGKRKRKARGLMEAIKVEMAKKLKSKEEILKIAKLNWVVEENLRFMCIENQIWHDLAHTNEVTAYAILTKLQVGVVHEDDTESCCAWLKIQTLISGLGR
ncbi:hypothetical protein Fmac_016324 [Flemingia macrophylla]|uniref:Uncharacterized protein n=1 Tax=Flemingia macrophylla TaxID=520843 RepID=A0ABD1MH29_9FABA